MSRARRPKQCAVCKAAALPGMGNLVECGKDIYLCKSCAETALRCFSAKPAPAAAQPAMSAPQTPREFAEELDKSVIGQREAKKALSVALWKHAQRLRGNTAVPPAHVLLYGPTGCGKTYLAQCAAKLLDVPFVRVDATTFSETGYKGRDVQEIVFNVLHAAKTRSQAEHAVVFVDEFDKLSARGGGDRQAYQRGTQHAFLTMLEGGVVTVENKQETAELDVSSLLFIFAGAFPGLDEVISTRLHSGERAIGFGSQPLGKAQENTKNLITQAVSADFMTYGVEPELIGRISVLAPILPLGAPDLVRILTEADGSVAAQYGAFFSQLGIDFTLEPAAAAKLAELAHETSTGARGLRGWLEQLIASQLFDMSESKSIRITVEQLEGGGSRGRKRG